MAVFDPGTGPVTPPLPTTPPPAWQFAKTPGGGIASPTFVDPTTGEYIDPYTGTGTGFNTTGDSVSGKPGYDITQNPAPPGWHWQDGHLVEDAPTGGPTGPTGPTGPSGPTGPAGTQVPIGMLPRVTPPPPPDATGYTPQGRGEAGREGDSRQPFSSLIPRVAGNDVARPGDISGMRAQVPTWARGLQRSPYARALGRSGQSGFGQIGGFQPEVAPDQSEEIRRQQAILALGLPPVA